ncbi:MAG: protein kinase [Bryobacteraceae bacterium]|nr:protein kinase [Bryobacteraceae bacterium]
MSPERWEKVKEIFAEALDQPPDGRASWVRDHCGDDPTVAAEVTRLLQFSPTSKAFLDEAALPPGLLQRAASAPELFSLEPGETLAGRFVIIRRLGAGGMGEVYEAEDRNLGSRLAVKIIRAEIARDPQVLARFRREVNLARQVTHPNVCRVFDLAHGTLANGRELDFLTMEYLDGETLSSYLEGRPPLTLAQAGPLIRQIAEGLGAAHQAGVIHRDLKGSNILLARQADSEVRVAITDFGLARSIAPTDASTLTQSGWGAGTPAYMAPEQLEGGPTSPASDFYSLGVVMYEMATGRPPHGGQSPIEIAVRRLKQRPAAPREITPTIDPKWEAVILRCLEPDPADRFSDAASLLAALGNRKILSSVRPSVRRRLSRALGWLAPLLALLVAGAWWTLRTPTLAEPSQRLYNEALNALADGSYLKANRLLEQTVRQEPDFIPATLRLAETYLELDQIRQAQATLLRVSGRWIPAADPRLLRDALRLLILRDYDAAIPILAQRAAGANSTQSQLDLARALERANRLDESESQLRQVVQRDPAQAGALLRLAAVASAKADRPGAERYLGEAQQAYTRFGNAEGQGEADLVRANMAKDLNELARARESAQAGAERGQQTGSPWLEIRAQLVQAAIDVLDAKPDEATKRAEAAVARAREAGLETLACQGLIDLGIAHLSQVQDRRAEQVHREALAIAERNDAPFYAASARLGLAMDLSGQSRGEESVAMAQQAHAYFAKTSFRLKKIESLRVLGHAYFSLSDWSNAGRYYGEAATLANRPWEAALRMRNLQSQADVEMRYGNFPEVRTANQAILREAEARRLPALVTLRARLALANVARLLGQYPEANRLTDELLNDPASQNAGLRQQILNARVSLLAVQGKTAAALALAEEILTAADREGRKGNREDMEVRRCGILAVDPASEARTAVRQCQAVLAKFTDASNQSAADARLALAEALLRQGDFPAATAATQQALATFTAKRSKNNVFYCHLLQAAIDQAAGRVAGAAASRSAATVEFQSMVARWPAEDQRTYLARPAVARLSQRAQWTQ